MPGWIKRPHRAISRLLPICIMAFLGSLLFARCAATTLPPGVGTGVLAPCPETPNCVSSLAKDPEKRIEPLPLQGRSDEDAIRRLERLIGDMPRARIRTRTENYLHAEFRTRFFHFVDDVEFRADEEQGVVQLRSASRLGYSDFGVNRRRLEQIRSIWLEQP